MFPWRCWGFFIWKICPSNSRNMVSIGTPTYWWPHILCSTFCLSFRAQQEKLLRDPKLCVANDHGSISFVEMKILSFSHSWLNQVCNKGNTRGTTSKTGTDYLSGTHEVISCFSGFHVDQSLVVCALSFFLFGHCIVSSSSNYRITD